MIARLWSARTSHDLTPFYLEHFSRSVQPRLSSLRGFLGFTVGTDPLPGGLVEIVVTTLWESFAAIDAFAGSDRESAVVADEAAALLKDFDRRVHHYQLALAEFPAKT